MNNCKEIWSAVIAGDVLPVEMQEVFDAHKGHELELVKYGGAYYAIECLNCHEVLFDDEALVCQEG